MIVIKPSQLTVFLRKKSAEAVEAVPGPEGYDFRRSFFFLVFPVLADGIPVFFLFVPTKANKEKQNLLVFHISWRGLDVLFAFSTNHQL